MWMVSQNSQPHPRDIEAQGSAGEDSFMNAVRFGMLCEHWRHQEAPGSSCALQSEALQRSIECMSKTLEPYYTCLSVSDRQLYAEWKAARRKEDIRALLFDCFQLMCRTRGPAVAILRIQEIARLIG